MVRIRSWSTADRTRIEKSLTSQNKGSRAAREKTVRERIVIESVCDESGQLTLSGADIPALGKLDSRICERIVKAAMEHNNVGEDDFEALVGNSDETTPDSST